VNPRKRIEINGLLTQLPPRLIAFLRRARYTKTGSTINRSEGSGNEYWKKMKDFRLVKGVTQEMLAQFRQAILHCRAKA
jgi:hypothetical protein